MKATEAGQPIPKVYPTDMDGVYVNSRGTFGSMAKDEGRVEDMFEFFKEFVRDEHGNELEDCATEEALAEVPAFRVSEIYVAARSRLISGKA